MNKSYTNEAYVCYLKDGCALTKEVAKIVLPTMYNSNRITIIGFTNNVNEANRWRINYNYKFVRINDTLQIQENIALSKLANKNGAKTSAKRKITVQAPKSEFKDNTYGKATPIKLSKKEKAKRRKRKAGKLR